MWKRTVKVPWKNLTKAPIAEMSLWNENVRSSFCKTKLKLRQLHLYTVWKLEACGVVYTEQRNKPNILKDPNLLEGALPRCKNLMKLTDDVILSILELLFHLTLFKLCLLLYFSHTSITLARFGDAVINLSLSNFRNSKIVRRAFF